MQDSVLTRAIAKQRAAVIEQDICTGNFDKTLLRYRPRALGQNPTELNCPELFERYTQWAAKDRNLQEGSLCRYQGCLANLRRYLNKPASGLSVHDVENFRAALSERLSPSTARSYLGLLVACFDWAVGKFWVPEQNPFKGQSGKVRIQFRQKTKPFSEHEIRLILEGFKADRHYAHYYPVIRFLFATGCRPGEAFGLKWPNISDDFKTVTFCEAASKGKSRDRTKTGRSRVVNLAEGITQMLREMAAQAKPGQTLVFPSQQGQIINDHTFRRRGWKSVLERVGVPYRKLYGTRHSAASHAIASGANYVEVAEQLGHDPQVLHDHYVSAVNSRILFKEF
jgi:integrase